MSDFSIQKMFASALNGYDAIDDKKNMEKQTRQVPPETFYNGLLGAHLGNTTNTGATKVD